MEKKYALIALSVFAIAIVAALVFYPENSSNRDSFAQCLTEKGAVEYGAYWCNHCAEQKKMFGSSFKYVNYVECDPKGENARADLCEQAGIKGYPTWIINDQRFEGVQSFAALSAATNCTI